MSSDLTPSDSRAATVLNAVHTTVFCKHRNLKVILLGTGALLLGLEAAFCLLHFLLPVRVSAVLTLLLAPILMLYGPWSCACKREEPARRISRPLTSKESWTFVMTLLVGATVWISMVLYVPTQAVSIFAMMCLGLLGAFKMLKFGIRNGKLISERDGLAKSG